MSRRVRRTVTNPPSWIRGLRVPPGTVVKLEPEIRWKMTPEEREATLS